MRAFNFKARSIGDEKFLTYTIGEECELDDSVLDYCEDNNLKELIEIIYEEDDDYEYLSYDITGRISLDDYISNEIKCEAVINILRNISLELIELKEQNISLSYLLLNKSFIYVDVDSFELSFICIPIESKATVAAEFKGFVRQLLANMKYDVDEDLNYVGKLLTYINGDSFNLRGLIGLCEALLDEAGISFTDNDSINAEGGVEVVDAVNMEEEGEDNASKVNSFMSDIPQDDEPLPEIGDDEQDDEALSEMDDEPLPETDDESLAETDDEPIPETDDEPLQKKGAEPLPEADDEPLQKKGVEPLSETDDEPLPKAGDDEQEMVKEPAAKAIDEAPLQTSELRQKKGQTTGHKKELDMDLVKNRIKELVSNGAAQKNASQEPIKTLADLDDFLGGKPPVIKKNVVKVNRAALIQNLAEQESEMDGADEQEQQAVEETAVEEAQADTPVTTDESEAEGADETPKSNSVLSKTVADVARATNLLSIPQAIPYLVRVNTEERVMLDRTVFKIGKGNRGVDYSIRGNGAISRQHAIILQKDGVCYIKDNKSTNHTYVNGKIVEEGVEEILTHDSLITLGDEDFLFKIR